jgi:hypothetical protein
MNKWSHGFARFGGLETELSHSCEYWRSLARTPYRFGPSRILDTEQLGHFHSEWEQAPHNSMVVFDRVHLHIFFCMQRESTGREMMSLVLRTR